MYIVKLTDSDWLQNHLGSLILVKDDRSATRFDLKHQALDALVEARKIKKRPNGRVVKVAK